MRIARFRLDAWGHYERGVTLDFPARLRDLHVVRGDNEAGKSTLLDGLTSLLFGIDKGTPRAFQWGEANLALSGEGALADGRFLAWTRRGGRKAPFAGSVGGTPLDAPRLSALLGGVDRARWAALFGFSGEQLARAGEELKQVPLSQVVSGAVDPRKVAAGLIAEAEALYKGGNRAKNPRVNTEAARIRELEQRAQAESVLPRQWRELEGDEARTREALTAARGALRRAEAALGEAVRRRSAWGLLVEKSRLAQERAALGPATGLAPGDRPVYEELARRRDEQRAALTKRTTELAGRLAERAAIVLPEAILAAAAEIDRLVSDRRARAEDEDRVGKLHGQVREQRAALEARVAALLPGQDAAARLTAIPTDTGTRTHLTALARAAAELGQRRTRTTSDRARLAGDRAALQERLGRLPAEEDVSELQALVERGSAMREVQRTLVQDQEALERLATPLAQQRSLLGAGWPERRPAPHDLPAPAEAEEADRELTRLRKRVDDAEASRAAADAERARHHADLAALDRQRELPTPERLATLRAERATAWEPVRRALLVGPPPPPMHAQALVNPFELLVQRADQHADAMYAEAQAVARRVHLSTLVEHADARVAELVASVEVAVEAVRGFEARWAGRCEAAGLLPISPAVLRAWLRDHATWWTMTAEHTRLDVRIRWAEAEVATFERELRAACPTATPTSRAEGMLRQIDAQVKAASIAAGERNGLKEQGAALARDEATLEELQRVLAGDEQTLATSIVEVRRHLDLPDGLAIADWPAWLNEVQTIQEALRRLAAMETEAVATRDRLAAWEEEVRARLSPLLSLPAGTPVPACVDAAARSLTEARRLRDQAAQLDALLPRLQEEAGRAETTLAEVEARLATARGRTGAPDDATWLAQARAAEHASEVDSALGRIEAALSQLRGPLDPAAAGIFDASVLEAGVTTLQADEAAATAAVPATAAAVDGATRAHQDAYAALTRIDTSANAAWSRTEAEEQRQRLRAGVEEWVTLQLASRLLAEALRRYEAGEEPAVYRRTGELFQRMTGGRYTEVRPVGGHHLLHAWRVDGEELDSAQLSEGTRQQLYLAARLAWAERHCARFEPLPLVLDDVLAAFDDRRATATIGVLAELSERMQVILLTHHPHVSDLVCAAEPTVAPVHLTTAPSA